MELCLGSPLRVLTLSVLLVGQVTDSESIDYYCFLLSSIISFKIKSLGSSRRGAVVNKSDEEP